MKLVDLQLEWPSDSHTISQHFGDNANPLYSGQGLKGHPGLDIDAPYDSQIYDATKGKGFVYKIFHHNDPVLMDYRAICELLELEDCVLEITYGHCNKTDCPLGNVSYRQVVATVGNTGEVYVGSHEVTEAEKDAGSTAGRHIHFQIRPCQKVKGDIDPAKFYLANLDNTAYRDNNGYIYQILDYANGYNGCTDPLPYITANIQGQIIQTQLSLIQVLQKYVGYLKGLLGK